jgi:hypothetical protein
MTEFRLIGRVGVLLVAALLADVAGTTEVFVGLGVVDEQFTVLAVATGFVGGNLDHVPDRGGLAEDGVHFFQRPVGGFRVEEVDDGEDEGVAIF